MPIEQNKTIARVVGGVATGRLSVRRNRAGSGEFSVEA